MPATIDDLNNIPVKFVNGATVFVKDVGQVHDGWLVQQNIVRANGQRSVLLSIIKNGNASTLGRRQGGRRQRCKTARAAAPPGMQINELFDQSVFVKQSIAGVLREGAIAAGLTALMIVLFLGSWRSTLVVMISIPLAILTSLVVLYFLGETLNTMTLGGLALAVGILVDDSTVTIENTHRLLTEEGMPLPQATLHGAAGIAVPTLVSTLAISCVFTSVVFLDGPAKYLFTPLGLAVVFAMLASYGLSRTLTPIMIGLLLKGEHHGARRHGRLVRPLPSRLRARLRAYARRLCRAARRAAAPAPHRPGRRGGGPRAGRYAVSRSSGATSSRRSTAARSSCMSARRPAPGSRRPSASSRRSRTRSARSFPERDRELIVDNIGLPARAYNLAFTDGSTIGVNDGVILVALKEGHAPTADYVRKLREALPAAFPEDIFYFQAADMVTQILNFGLPAQIDVRTVGYDRANNLRVAKELRRRIAAIPGIADAHLQQEVDAPAFYAEIDRTRAAQLGLNANTIANQPQRQPELVGAGHAQFLDRSDERHSLLSCGADARSVRSARSTISATRRSRPACGLRPTMAATRCPGLLSNVATLQRGSVPTNANQANIQPVYEVYASVQGRDLGSVAADIGKIVAELQKAAQARQHHPGGRPDRQHERPRSRDLGIGLLFAAVFVYLLMVVNYQNFGDPFVVHPGAAGDLLRHPHHAVHHRHHAQRALADGRDHGGRRRLGEFDPAGDLRARAAARRQDGLRGGASTPATPASGRC